MSSEVAPTIFSEQTMEESVSRELHGKKVLRRFDSLDIESSTVPGRHGHASKAVGWSVVLHLAFQSIGIVYGDIGTSPLYVYASTFSKGIKHNDDVLGVLSLIFYTLTLIPLVKYVFIVLQANDNGEGGTFALYSLICRYAKVGLIPNQQAEDKEVSNFQLELRSNRLWMASRVKSKLESGQFAKFFLLLATMLGTAMVIGDGVLTPCMSVLSAVGGIKEATSALTDDMIVWISVVILIFLFMIQRFGTDKVGYTFAPIICVWFAFIGGIGLFNFIKFDPTVIKAINPKYIVQYFQRNKREAWVSLGGTVLAITGTEALFADVGHFTVRSIQISMCSVTYPALILAYTGQASFLRKHNDLVKNTFFESIPDPLYWPMVFSSGENSAYITKYAGQVYIPEVNYLLMLACIGVTLGFRSTAKIGNAYGIAVVFVMTLTSAFLVLIMIMIWKTNILLIVSYVLVIGTVELLYLSSVLYKFDQGGYLPLAFAAVLMTIMYTWNDVHRRKYFYELNHKVSLEKLKEIAADTKFCRLPGLALFYSELVQGIPPIFKHYVANVPVMHSTLVFSPSSHYPSAQFHRRAFPLSPCGAKHQNVFRCVMRYGYTDRPQEQESLEKMLVDRLKEFIKDDFWFSQVN
ncbi:hypothetical protein SLA2020_389100 [Shorea laevis]